MSNIFNDIIKLSWSSYYK